MLRPYRQLLATGLLAIAMTFGMASTATAQTASPAATPGGPSEGYPVAIHQGTCEAPVAKVAWDIANAIGVGVDQSDSSGANTLGTVQGVPVLEASAKIDVKLEDLGHEPYIVAVHASANDDSIVACGTIGGLVADGKLVIPLLPSAGSSVYGIATFDSDKSGVLGLGGDQTQVHVYVFDANSSPSATPAA